MQQAVKKAPGFPGEVRFIGIIHIGESHFIKHILSCSRSDCNITSGYL